MIKDNDFNIENRSLISIIIYCLFVSVIITIIHNTSINSYIRDIVIPFGLMIGVHIFLIRKNMLEINKKAYIFIIPIIFILLSDIIVRIDISNKIINVFILPVLISTFFFLLINKNYKINKESLNWVFKLFPIGIFNNLKYVKEAFSSVGSAKVKTILNILFGSLIGIPIAIVILYLLANADKYFNEFIGFILDFVSRIINTNFVFSNLLTTIITFAIIFSIFINLIKNKNSKLKPVICKELNHTIGSTILVIINIIFLLFLISEISKITVNFLQLPIQYTYAEYAREGFFQLLLVTTINFAIIIYYTYYTKIVDNNKFVKKLILLLIGFSIILIFNSYYRMFLYIGAYGFTILRLQVILFLAMELILFSTLIKKIISKLKYKDAIIFYTIILLFYILNIYLCTNRFVSMLNSF